MLLPPGAEDNVRTRKLARYTEHSMMGRTSCAPSVEMKKVVEWSCICRKRLLVLKKAIKRAKRREAKWDFETCHYESEGTYTDNYGPESTDDDER